MCHPASAAANKTPALDGQSTLAATPIASITQATLKVRGTPKRDAAFAQRATDGIAVRPDHQPDRGSAARTSGEPRTIATRNVAVMT